MKMIILLSGLVLLLINVLLGLILSSFDRCHVVISSVVIMVTTLLLYLTTVIQLKDGYKISLALLFLIAGVFEYVLALYAPNQFKDNWWLIVVVLFMAFEIILLIVTNTISKKIK